MSPDRTPTDEWRSFRLRELSGLVLMNPSIFMIDSSRFRYFWRAICVLIFLIISAKSFSEELSDESARAMVEAEWRKESFLPLKLGTLGVLDVYRSETEKTSKSFTLNPNIITIQTLRGLQAAQKIGLLTIRESADSGRQKGGISNWDDWMKVVADGTGYFVEIASTENGRNLARQAGLPVRKDWLLVPMGRFQVTRVVKSEPRNSSVAEETRLVMFTYDADWTPEYKELARVYWGEELSTLRKARVLLRYDPFRSGWEVVAEDVANIDAEFATNWVGDYLGGDRRGWKAREWHRQLLNEPEPVVKKTIQTTETAPLEASSLVSLAEVCPSSTLGEFRHGTKCTGFYDQETDAGKLRLVDIQVAGTPTLKKYTTTKSLVHAGVDLVAEEGAAVFPIADGTVDEVIGSPNDNNFPTLGYMVIVEHTAKINGKATFSLYLHLKEKPFVTMGQAVVAGKTRLGLVGATGAATGPHLHLEVRHFPGRFFGKWKNIYGIERPRDIATFDEKDFIQNWEDPSSALSLDSSAVTDPNSPAREPSKKDTLWENSLGMKFAPVSGLGVAFSIWETRVREFQAFVVASKREWTRQPFAQGDTHPAVNVSLNDAKAFCEWLTEKERNEGKIETDQVYRLPSDWEWSIAVGLGEKQEGSPKQKHAKIEGVFPWGTQWPPPKNAGNYFDKTATQNGLTVFMETAPDELDDGFAYTAPVGSFAANQFGLYDMGGNVCEWVDDFFNGKDGARTLRGSGYVSGYVGPAGSFLSSWRQKIRDGRYTDVGFRIVLTPIKQK